MAKRLVFRAAELYSEKLYITTPFIKLDSALKLAGAAATGGEAKMYIENGFVRVNGEECTARGRKLRDGDKINFKNSVFWVEKRDEHQ